MGITDFFYGACYKMSWERASTSCRQKGLDAATKNVYHSLCNQIVIFHIRSVIFLFEKWNRSSSQREGNPQWMRFYTVPEEADMGP